MCVCVCAAIKKKEREREWLTLFLLVAEGLREVHVHLPVAAVRAHDVATTGAVVRVQQEAKRRIAYHARQRFFLYDPSDLSFYELT